MVSTLLLLGGTFVALLLLLALIVRLSARPADRRGTGGSRDPRMPSWVADQGRPHPDAWAPLTPTTSEMRSVR
ncbi:hypothetical protein GB931_12310 [Modestobacter sp. I12A-02628]|uniref:Uncharacterized protein n=1 Tax=Goekera deserti TaxID=2497753 RepID=A0A7K3W9G8_9ACTN|nr:hypothetical protein [Goekera deserti]MPQ98687.1 hypothetical protein [Goekera deserti]NDI49249.1 hypothetical protein [Goekera deserti]NEL52987.1 hypothetical protein [Goekera deserti]